MNHASQAAIELALEKQRLLLESAMQRESLVRHGAALVPWFDRADQVRRGGQWLKHHPEALVGVLGAVAVARPGVRRFLWHWTRRGFVAWRLWRNSFLWLRQNIAVSPAPTFTQSPDRRT